MSEHTVTLTIDEWDEVVDALSFARLDAEDHAEMWRHRSREKRYRTEADRLTALTARISSQIEAK